MNSKLPKYVTDNLKRDHLGQALPLSCQNGDYGFTQFKDGDLEYDFGTTEKKELVQVIKGISNYGDDGVSTYTTSDSDYVSILYNSCSVEVKTVCAALDIAYKYKGNLPLDEALREEVNTLFMLLSSEVINNPIERNKEGVIDMIIANSNDALGIHVAITSLKLTLENISQMDRLLNNPPVLLRHELSASTRRRIIMKNRTFNYMHNRKDAYTSTRHSSYEEFGKELKMHKESFYDHIKIVKNKYKIDLLSFEDEDNYGTCETVVQVSIKEHITALEELMNTIDSFAVPVGVGTHNLFLDLTIEDIRTILKKHCHISDRELRIVQFRESEELDIYLSRHITNIKE